MFHCKTCPSAAVVSLCGGRKDSTSAGDDRMFAPIFANLPAKTCNIISSALLDIIDLYCGVGGLSLGAARAGFRVAAAVDNDPIAMGSHSKNFPLTKHLTGDVSRLGGDDLLELAGLRKGQLDGLVGGPPC